MKIMLADYKGSFPQTSLMPKGGHPEFAFIGRSNVGKSSLINLLTDRKELAHTSAKPGKTQSINYYLINKQWSLIDLPGYGYARVAKSVRNQFGAIISDYIANSEGLVCLFVLIDANVPPQPIDISFTNWLGENGIPFCIVFTKTDRQKPEAAQANIEAIKTALLEYWNDLPPLFLTSAVTRAGREEILEYIQQVVDQLETV